MTKINTNLLAKRKELLQFYSPYQFLREILAEKQWHNIILPILETTENQVIDITINEKEHQFLVKKLSWDTDFFGIPTYKLVAVLYEHTDFEILTKAVEAFKTIFHCEKINNQEKKYYLFSEIPHEDILLLQAITKNGFRLVESRINYYKNNVKDFSNERFSVRKAVENDIPNIRKTAIEAQNDYDRVHADPSFSKKQADDYLAIYAENCVRGFAEMVLVPDDDDDDDDDNKKGGNVPTEAFLAIGRHEKDAKLLETSFARIMLTAALPTCKGWHYKLMSETIQYAKENSIAYVLMTTQVTNKAVFRNAFKLGFEIGNITHIFAL